MFCKVVAFVVISLASLKASAQTKIIINGKTYQLTDSLPRINTTSPKMPFTPEDLAALLRVASKMDSASAPRDNMTVIRPDLKNFSSFPAVDPTKKSGYVADNMPNGHMKLNSFSLKKDPVK
jgi:hypothetical protein